MVPPAFYRVQCDSSFTDFYRGSFQARPEDSTDAFLCKWGFERHLDWYNTASSPSPFISVFDNRADAEDRAYFLLERGHTGVFIAKISIQHPQWESIYCYPDRYSRIEVPVLVSRANARGSSDTVFIPTSAVREHLGVSRRVSQLSEWFVLETIPGYLVTEIRRLS